MSMKTMRLQLGLVVMGGAVLLGCMIILFGTMPRFWEKSDTYYAQFEDAPGVSSGTPVRRSGVRVGQVADIVLDEETGMVLVHFSLANPFKLRKHEIPTLNTGLLANDATIDLVPDAEGKDKSILEAGSVVLGKRAATVNSLLQNASAVVPTTQEALDEMRKSLQKLEKLSPLLQESLKEVRDLAKDVRLAIPEIKEGALATFKQYETLGKQANELLPKVNVNFEKAVADIRETAKSATSTFKEIDKIGADISAAARQIGGTAERVDRFVQQNADKMSKTIDSTIETVNRIGNILNDDNQKQFGAILKNTKKASDRFDGMAQNFLDVSQEIQESVKWFIQFTRQLDESADPNRRTPRTGAQRPGAQRPGAQRPIGALPQFPGGAYPLVGGVQGVIASNIRPTTQTVPLEGGIPALKTSQYTPIGQTLPPPIPGTPRPLPGSLPTPPAGTAAGSPVGISGARVGMLLRDLDETVVGINDFVGEVKGLFKGLAEGDGALQKFLNDPTVYYRIDQILMGVVQQIPTIARILNNAEVFMDKLARHPEALGLGGVVRPGSGIKDSPSSTGGLRIPPK